MKEWIPLGNSAKARLATAALREFGARGYADVGVGELAAKAGVTTGSLYHHFDNKLGLYRFVRHEADRRMLDRMEGAAAARAGDAPSDVVRAVLVVSFDSAAAQGLACLLAEPPSDAASDPIETFIRSLLPDSAPLVSARLLTAVWREALRATVDGTLVEQARAALSALSLVTTDEIDTRSHGRQHVTRAPATIPRRI